MATNFKTLAERRSDIFHIKTADIVERSGWNEREMDTQDNQDALRELVDSIKAVGVKEPLTGYFDSGKAVITNGHRRYRAVVIAISEGAPIETLPFQTEARGTDEAGRVASMLVRNSGKPLTPFEASKVVVRLVGWGWTTAKIAQAIGKTESYVNQLIQLQETAPEVKELVKEGKVAAATAVRTARKEGGAERLKQAVKDAEKAGKKKVTPKAIQNALVPSTGSVGKTQQEYRNALLKAASLLLAEAIPGRYDAVPPAWWPLSNAEWKEMSAWKATRWHHSHEALRTAINLDKENPDDPAPSKI